MGCRQSVRGVNIPSIKRKADFCFRWIDSIFELRSLNTAEHRDESMHMAFAFDVVDTARAEEPDLFDDTMRAQVREMLAEAVECEVQFAEDLLEQGVSGMSLGDMREYLQHVADRRLAQLGIDPLYGSKNPFTFMDLQDVQELSNFFERRVSAYQVGVTGTVAFDDDF